MYQTQTHTTLTAGPQFEALSDEALMQVEGGWLSPVSPGAVAASAFSSVYCAASAVVSATYYLATR